MSNEQRDHHLDVIETIHLTGDAIYCDPTAEGHCITCSDEAVTARVLHVDQKTGLALVAVKDTTEEIDITLVESVVPGDTLLVHGGVAIASLDEASDE